MSKKLYSKDHYYQPILCEACNKETDIVHSMHAYHAFYGDPVGYLRPAFLCTKCFFSTRDGQIQTWIPSQDGKHTSHWFSKTLRKGERNGTLNRCK